MPGRNLFFIFASLHAFCLVLMFFVYVYAPKIVPQIAVNEVLPSIETVLEVPDTPESSSVVKAETKPIYFVGDVMLGRHVEYLMMRYGAGYPYAQLGFLTDTPSYVVANFEASMPPLHVKTPNFGFSFSVSKKYLPAFARAGFTHVSLANNHATDYGNEGYEGAKNSLQAVGLATFGEPTGLDASTSISYIMVDNTAVAILGLHTLFSEPSESEIRLVMAEASKNSALQIVYVHWGTEYERIPRGAEQDLATTLIKAGADLIIGHHPHVVQSVELIDSVPVFYSLGNFIFDQYFSVDVQQGLVLKLDLHAKSPYIELIPVSTQGSNAQPLVLQNQEKHAFLDRLSGISTPTLKDYILDGRLPLHFNLATSTETAMMKY